MDNTIAGEWRLFWFRDAGGGKLVRFDFEGWEGGVMVRGLGFFFWQTVRLLYGINCVDNAWVRWWGGLGWEGVLQADCQVFADGGRVDSDVLSVSGCLSVSCV